MRKYILLLLFVLTFFQFAAASKRVSGKKVFNANGLELFNVEHYKTPSGKDKYRLRDLTYQHNLEPAITDFSLPFNSSPEYLRDHAGRYRIISSDYDLINEKGVLGGGAALFYKNEHGVKIQTSDKLWMNENDDLGSFSIEFRFKVNKLRNGSIFFSRVGYLSGVKNGIEIKLENNMIRSDLWNLFEDKYGRRKSFSLRRTKKISENKWYYFCLSYDRISGRITQILNENEADMVFATENSSSESQLLIPSFSKEDSPVVILGKNYNGCLDEFRITFRNFEELSKISDVTVNNYRDIVRDRENVRNREGVITSPVYEFEKTGTMINLFKWDEKLEKNTFVWMEFRISDKKFDKNNKVLKWYRVKNKQRNIYLKKVSEGYLRGKYFQWRAHLISSPNGKYSPEISDITVFFETDGAPERPLFFEAVDSGDQYVSLRWKMNVDHDIYGYKIYYGVRPGEYEGIITVFNGKRISNSMADDNGYIEVRIDNSVVRENIIRRKKGMLDYPEIKNTVLYFFSVSAYDSYKPDSPYNHESELSEEISARPFAGSEI